MKYTFKLITNAEMTEAEKAFTDGLQQAFELNPQQWIRITDDEEDAEVCVRTDFHGAFLPSKFLINWWSDGTPFEEINGREYIHGPSGHCSFFYRHQTYYYKNITELENSHDEALESKSFFPSLRRLYSTDTPNQLGYAVGCALNDLMLVESIYEEWEEHT